MKSISIELRGYLRARSSLIIWLGRNGEEEAGEKEDWGFFQAKYTGGECV
jgi:hypothetical protein